MEISFTTCCVILGFFVSTTCDILYMSDFVMLLYYILYTVYVGMIFAK